MPNFLQFFFENMKTNLPFFLLILLAPLSVLIRFNARSVQNFYEATKTMQFGCSGKVVIREEGFKMYGVVKEN